MNNTDNNNHKLSDYRKIGMYTHALIGLVIIPAIALLLANFLYSNEISAVFNIVAFLLLSGASWYSIMPIVGKKQSKELSQEYNQDVTEYYLDYINNKDEAFQGNLGAYIEHRLGRKSES